MHTPKIAVIGAGQIGSRHLQALALYQEPAQLFLVDPSEASLKTALERIGQVGPLPGHLDIRPFTSLEALPDPLDLVVVATAANVRRAVIDELISKKQVRYLILEKFLFQRIDDFAEVQSSLRKAGVAAWVNCPRRAVAFYRELRESIAGSQRLHFNVTGSNIGIGCNAIHFLDLMAFLARESEFSLSPQGLDPKVYPSKRPGFVEFCGNLQGYSGSGSPFSITSFREGSAPITIHLATEDLSCLIREGEGKAWISSKDQGWRGEERAIEIPFQSRLTHLLAKEILETGTSRLTPLEESSRLHVSILGALSAHMALYSSEGGAPCPIT